MLSINTNLSSLIVQSNLLNSTLGLNQAIERMTTGFKLNHAKDNAANFSISTLMSTKIGAYSVAEENALMGLDMLKTVSDSLDGINDKLSRLRALAVQAQNGTYGSSSKEALKKEAEALVSEITRLTGTTEYNGIKLFGEGSKPNINGKEITRNADGFIKDVVHRDTSTMTAVADIDPAQTITSGTYSISTKEEWLKLCEMGRDYRKLQGGEFVLSNDLDLSGVNEYIDSFTGTFDGNGYTISNLETGAFVNVDNSEIKNLGLKNSICINGSSPLAFYVENTNITNCYATGSVSGLNFFFSGLVGLLQDGTIDSCWTDVDIEAESAGSGGLVGAVLDGTISNSFSLGDVSNFMDVDYAYAGGIAGCGGGTIENCYTSSKVHSEMGSDYEGAIVGYNGDLGTTYYDITLNNVTYDPLSNPGMDLYGGHSDLSKITATNVLPSANTALTIYLQVGIDSSSSSRISFSTAFSLDGLSSNIESPVMLDNLDKMLQSVSSKQAEFGAVQNRLESVIEEINIKYENLVSSHSTIMDADIAEESSEYIKMQILQQASATLLATANQTPAIALQLL